MNSLTLSLVTTCTYWAGNGRGWASYLTQENLESVEEKSKNK